MDKIRASACSGYDFSKQFDTSWNHSRFMLANTFTKPSFLVSIHAQDYDPQRWRCVACSHVQNRIRLGIALSVDIGTGRQDALLLLLYSHCMLFVVLRSIYSSGVYYEKSLTIAATRFLTNETRPGVVVDVGASVGWLSLYAGALGHQVIIRWGSPPWHDTACVACQAKLDIRCPFTCSCLAPRRWSHLNQTRLMSCGCANLSPSTSFKIASRSS